MPTTVSDCCFSITDATAKGTIKESTAAHITIIQRSVRFLEGCIVAWLCANSCKKEPSTNCGVRMRNAIKTHTTQANTPATMAQTVRPVAFSCVFCAKVSSKFTSATSGTESPNTNGVLPFKLSCGTTMVTVFPCNTFQSEMLAVCLIRLQL